MEQDGATPSNPAPLRRFQSLLHRSANTESDELNASDVWWFMYTIQSRDTPTADERLSLQQQPHSRTKPRPKEVAVACRLCEADGGWHTWKCGNGQTQTIREHLQKHHYQTWHKVVVEEKLKGWEKLVTSATMADPTGRAHPSTISEPFTLDGFVTRLGNVIAENNLSINLVESESFREFVLYVSTAPDPLDDRDIPHRTQTHKILIERYSAEIKKLRADLQLLRHAAHCTQSALGRISFTCDLWSCRILKGFMAVTLHYCAKDQCDNLVLRTRLGAFRHVQGRHTGENLAQHFVQVLEELGILHKIGVITMDNGSNCGTMLDDLERILTAKGIRFHRKGNRIRCFPHVVNISVQRGLRALGCGSKQSELAEPGSSAGLGEGVGNEAGPGTDIEVPLHVEAQAPHDPNDPDFTVYEAELDGDNNEALLCDPDYADILSQNPIRAARNLINKARQSGQRREEFEAIVTDCIKNQTFGEGVNPSGTQLLRDVDTRWSSTFLMIDRLLSLYPVKGSCMSWLEFPSDAFFIKAVQILMRKHDPDALLSDKTLDVLSDIREFLAIPHTVQELLSAEHTPTASLVLPAYAELIEILKGARAKLPQLGHGIQAAISALEEYMAYTRQTRVYALAMAINPLIKFSWIQRNWNPDEAATARDWVIEAMLEYRTEARHRTMSVQKVSASAQGVGPSREVGGRSITHPHTTHISVQNARASEAQRRGLLKLADLRRHYSQSESSSSESLLRTDEGNADPREPMTEAQKAANEAQLIEEDRKLVQSELERYENTTVVLPDTEDSEPFSLLRYWQDHAKDFPYLYKVALDILPVPASSVPCERVFSACKDVDTIRRSGLDAAMLEVLQILKFALKQERLEFAATWRPAREEDMLGKLPLQPSTASQLIRDGRLDDFLRLIEESGNVL
ncbi:hypothetical protein BN946_scf184863.g12 [Trametes cinnabarina]|uniref:HAT C-terminal dimerisation domain-containing protein n=1 Tax=Pycnoporus cinnabarinus TaxID=5643 RepID=A0A060S9P9_PYCCI|nr:hypothetical protein BN946_scf184863.g12 [Trametes cinnabarina]